MLIPLIQKKLKDLENMTTFNITLVVKKLSLRCLKKAWTGKMRPGIWASMTGNHRFRVIDIA